MVQVDVFWAYALGAGFASAAARQLKDEANPFINKYFVYTLLFMSCIFAPSGIYLLWNFPDWETMQVARSHADLPAWLVVTFAVTNITQGILGYYVAYSFIRKGKYYAAHIQCFLGYFFMFFILMHGWDSLGWQRFLYDSTVMDGVAWTNGTHLGFDFLTSNVAMTLGGMGVAVVPALFIPCIIWIRQGAIMDKSLAKEKVPKNPVMIGIWLLIALFGVSIISAAVAALLVYYIGQVTGNLGIGFIIGAPVFALISYFLVFRKNMPGYLIFKQLFIEEPEA